MNDHGPCDGIIEKYDVVVGQRDALLSLVRSYLMTYPLDEYADKAASLVEDCTK